MYRVRRRFTVSASEIHFGEKPCNRCARLATLRSDVLPDGRPLEIKTVKGSGSW